MSIAAHVFVFLTARHVDPLHNDTGGETTTEGHIKTTRQENKRVSKAYAL